MRFRHAYMHFVMNDGERRPRQIERNGCRYSHRAMLMISVLVPPSIHFQAYLLMKLIPLTFVYLATARTWYTPHSRDTQTKILAL